MTHYLRALARVLALGALVAVAHPAAGQPAYPVKPVRMVTTEAGGGTDFATRLIAQGITQGIGQQVVVDNRPSGVIPGETVAKAPPDGYTLLVSTQIVWLLPFMQTAPFDPVRDFIPVTLAVTAPTVLVVHPSVTARSVKELVALAKARPGDLNYASSGIGSSTHLAGELFKSLAGVDVVRVPYKGGGPAMNDLLGGQVQMMFATPPSVVAHTKSGKLIALAVTSSGSTPLLPGLPPLSATVPGYESMTLIGVFVPAKTPVAVVKFLNQEIVRVLHRAEVKERFFAAGSEVVGSTADEFAATMGADMMRMGKIIKSASVRTD